MRPQSLPMRTNTHSIDDNLGRSLTAIPRQREGIRPLVVPRRNGSPNAALAHPSAFLV